METGEFLTRGTIWLALALYAASEACHLRMHAHPQLESWARGLWTGGVCAYVWHVAAAFHYYHGWSHTAAYADTARQTQELFGVSWGGGLYVNYLFTGVWLTETLWWWLSPESFRLRSRRVDKTIRAFFLFMIVNAAVVFPTGPIRWLGVAIVGALVVLWWRGRGSESRG